MGLTRLAARVPAALRTLSASEHRARLDVGEEDGIPRLR